MQNNTTPTLTLEPPPKMYPRAFLAERIPDVENLSPEAERDLLRKFAS